MLKNNWRECRERYIAFWNGASLDRPPVLFDSIGPLRHPMYNGAGYNYQKYGEDIESFCQDYEKVWEQRTDCIDDTVPSICPQMGGAIEAAFFGGEIDWGHETTFLVPHAPLKDVEKLADIEFSPDNKYFSRVLREVRVLSSLSNDRFGVNVEASVSLTTTISQLRGGTQFMFDLADNPEGIRALAQTIADIIIRLQTEVDSLVPHPFGGTCHRWLNYWNPGRGFWFSEDDAIMMSAAMYRDIFLDLDQELCNSAGCAVLHWHTAGLHLIDVLLQLERLRMIQISFDPNGPSLDQVLLACQRIENSGRKICFQMGFDPVKLRIIFSRLRPDSCMFCFSHARDIRAANQIVSEVESLSRNAKMKTT